MPTVSRVRWIFPVCGAPIVDGAIAIADGQIAEIGKLDDAVDLGNVAIVPGLVNAHTHLEFSGLQAPLGTPGMILPDWIRLVMAQRRAGGGIDSVSAGLRESLAAGTTTLGEIATRDWRDDSWAAATPTAVLFHEFIGPSPARAEAALVAAETFLNAHSTRESIFAGLSPHAPYTVHPHLLRGLVELSRKYSVPVAMHLAETREELELLHVGSGPFRELLEELGAWEASPGARMGNIMEYLQVLAHAPSSLVVHGNYLNAEEIEFVAAHRQSMSVIYCPRTHAYFEHEPYPLAALLRAGINVALGTDSRASNPDLSVLEEMKQAARNHPAIDPATLLEMATLGGAKALGLDASRGTLAPGKRADLAVVALEDSSTPADPHELLFAPRARVVATCLGGRWIGDLPAKLAGL